MRSKPPTGLRPWRPARRAVWGGGRRPQPGGAMAAGFGRRQPPSAGRCRGSRPANRNAGLVHVRTSGVVLLVSPGWRHRPQRRDRGAGVIGGRSSAFVVTVRQGRRADIEACARIVVADPLWRRYRLTLTAARRVLRGGVSPQARGGPPPAAPGGATPGAPGAGLVLSPLPGTL